jgi:hypothetical protein
MNLKQIRLNNGNIKTIQSCFDCPCHHVNSTSILIGSASVGVDAIHSCKLGAIINFDVTRRIAKDCQLEDFGITCLCKKPPSENILVQMAMDEGCYIARGTTEKKGLNHGSNY